jgi:hypothetical protein
LATDTNFTVTAFLVKGSASTSLPPSRYPATWEDASLGLANLVSDRVFECSCNQTGPDSQCAFCPRQSVTIHGVGGVAQFDRLAINRVGSDYSLLVTSSVLLNVTTPLFEVTPGPAVAYMLTEQPSNSSAGQPFPVQPELMFVDRGGNPTSSSPWRVAVSAEIHTNPTGVAQLLGTRVILTSSVSARFTEGA